MTGLEWILWSVLFTIYFVCVFTVCTVTFRKGHVLLGVVGIFIPILWLIGAVLPAKAGSRYEIDQRAQFAGPMAA